ncbi:MAG TPA: extracellular solute-binding protein [Xanthobacteraceae bacterium]|jgi:peptide/nickel transport system substrate-binding protein|nr:extracellular solute-binding protein [Xanthobacteraceae bacterium]
MAVLAQPVQGEPKHAIAMHGEPALPPNFAAMPYVNPAAPRGGRLAQGILGTFDSLNPLIVRGLAPPDIRGHVIEGLMARGYDEPFTLYGLIAQSVETDAARSYVTFTINPAAAFSDGKPITADDLIFSWQLLRDRGRPNHRIYYAKVVKAEALDARTVRFDFSGSGDRELPLILGLMPVLPRHAINPETFEETTFVPPVGSGPYVVAAVDPGKSVTLRRNPNYWGRDLALNRGLWNFEEIRMDFYRDSNSHFEAFKKGLYDFRVEQDPGRWEEGYDFPALREGRVVKEAFPSGLPKGMSGLVFNTRRPVFADIRVRQALSMLFDFEWINKNFYFGRYTRTKSYFDGSELSSHGIAADGYERTLLVPFPDVVRADILDGTWSPPSSDGSGRDRDSLRAALRLLSDAGYELFGTQLRSRETKKQLTFEIMVTTRDQERLALQVSDNFKRAGIAAAVRVVDAVQFDRRRLTYDFDMIQNRWDQSLSPGNEQAFYWGSAAASEDGTRNYMGAKSAAVDAMIAALLRAESRQDFVSATRALDRVLLSGFYVIPLFHAPEQWVARWTQVRHPERTPLSGYLPEAWWREPSP